MLLRLLPLGALCAAVLAACGGPADGGGSAARTERALRSPAPRSPLDLPRGIPLRSSGARADPAQTKVIRAWSDALRGGDIAAASARWAVPSKAQNGTPVITLGSRAAIRVFNSSLSCGALVTASAAAPGGFTIVTVRLTRRRGADCGAGAGAIARTAIRVRAGKIVEWYRLPDDPSKPQEPSPTPGEGGGTAV